MAEIRIMRQAPRDGLGGRGAPRKEATEGGFEAEEALARRAT